MHCPKCFSEKNGFMKGDQRYRCKNCRCNYTKSDPRGHPLAQKLLAVSLHLSGMSMNSIGVILGVTAQSVMRWIRWAADIFAPLPEPEESAVPVEMDEMHHFLLKKTKNFGSGRCWIIENFWGGASVIVLLLQKSKP